MGALAALVGIASSQPCGNSYREISTPFIEIKYSRLRSERLSVTRTGANRYPRSPANCRRMSEMRRNNGDSWAPSTKPISPSPTSIASGSTLNSDSTLSLALAGMPASAASATSFWRIFQPAADAGKPANARDSVESLLRVEPLAIEVGLGLIGLVEGGAESALLRRISAIRRQLATDLGYLL